MGGFDWMAMTMAGLVGGCLGGGGVWWELHLELARLRRRVRAADTQSLEALSAVHALRELMLSWRAEAVHQVEQQTPTQAAVEQPKINPPAVSVQGGDWGFDDEREAA